MQGIRKVLNIPSLLQEILVKVRKDGNDSLEVNQGTLAWELG